MKHKRFLYLVIIAVLVVAATAPLAASMAQAQTTLPTAATVAAQIKVGWNLGNTLDAQCGETAWGNPATTQALIDSVKAAGFNSIRIPAAWDCHADQTTYVIDSTWMARVKQVVDYAINDGMYVIINIHWDDGWLENHVTYADQTAVNAKQKTYWTQIANTFKNYDEHLLFAGTNEVHEDYGTPTAEYIAVQQSYNQTFVDAVRATGGNNASRTLVVQTYNTNMQFGLDYFTMPTDTIANHLIVETHFYDPYDYTLNASGPCLAWGAPYTQYSQCSWAQEAYVDNLFSQVRAKWVDAGIPVIIGEYGVVKRSGLDLNSRQYWNKYINQAAKANGIKTFYWDNGTSDFAIFDRNSGAIVDQGVLDAIKQGAGIGTGPTPTPTSGPSPTPTSYSGPTVTPTPTTNGSCTAITVPYAKDGVGDVCLRATSLCGYANSWNLTTLDINGTSYVNTYVAGSAIAPVNGGYTIHYVSTVSWGHFEIGGTCATGPTATVTPVTPVATTTKTATPGVATATATKTPTLGVATATKTPTLGVATATKTPTLGVATATKTATSGGGNCSPVTSTITAPFTYDGAGTFCWQSSNLGSYINSWNLTSLSINGTNETNLYVASGSYPAKINGYWYVSYVSTVAWGHFEAK